MYRKKLLCLLLTCMCIVSAISVHAAEVDCDASYCFTAEDFSDDDTLTGICVTGLPDKNTGSILLGTRVIQVGDILTKDQVKAMTFVPLETETDQVACITYLPIYENRVETTATMTISIRGKKDQPPVAQDQALETYKNLPNSAPLTASDPEGKALTYTVTRQPKRGQVEIAEDGTFTYTPKKNKVGVDSFVYTVTDPAGNVSREATVTINILKPSNATQYADTWNSNCRFEAEWLKNTGLFVGQQVGGQMLFDENAPVSQGEFLALAIRVLGIPVEDQQITDVYGENTPAWLKPYLAAALRSGLTAGMPSFSVGEAITGAQVAVMLQNALDLTVSAAATEGQNDASIPQWAQNAVAAMQENGIPISSAKPMTRGEMAVLLYRISKIVADAPGLKMFQ